MSAVRQIDLEKWQRRLVELGLDALQASALAALVRPSIALNGDGCVPDESLATGRSKLGGKPDLPAGMPWPMRKPYRLMFPRGKHSRMDESRPLAFLAQISLTDIAAVGGTDLSLPNWGLLSFFYDAESQPWGFDPGDAPQFQLMWFGERVLQRQEPPPTLNQRFNAVSLLPQARECVPAVATFAVSQILACSADPKSSREKLAGLFRSEEIMEEHSVSRHALGGWPCPIQQEMETECELVRNGIFCGGPDGFASERARRLRADAADWRLILQLATDDRAGWMWGDGGNIYVWMREQDVRARRFDRCWTILQCY